MGRQVVVQWDGQRVTKWRSDTNAEAGREKEITIAKARFCYYWARFSFLLRHGPIYSLPTSKNLLIEITSFGVGLDCALFFIHLECP